MRVAVLSSTKFGENCINLISTMPNMQIVGIMTTPREIKVPYSNKSLTISHHTTFWHLEKKLGIGIAEVAGEYANQELPRFIEIWKPDLILALGWYYMIPKEVFMKVPCCVIHASMLPKYRGHSPVTWAIINGEEYTGVTLFYVNERVDAGDIIGQFRIAIDHDETTKTLYNKVQIMSYELLKYYLPTIADGTARITPQDESQATYVPARKPEDGLIDWTWDARRIDCFIRGQTKPYPGAYTIIEGKKITIWDAKVEEIASKD